MKKLSVFISGQKYFGQQVFDLCNRLEYVDIIGVCCPLDDNYIGSTARLFEVPITPAGHLTNQTMPAGVDLGITAHSFDYIGRLTRYKTRLGWLGYHPSLLPRHRGRSSIEWAVRMRDVITGGTVFWLNAGIDRGDIAYQDWCWIEPRFYLMNPKEAAKHLWNDKLQAIGLTLFELALKDLSDGVVKRLPQCDELSTFEPNTDVKDVFRPDLLMIEQYGGEST